MTLNFPYNPSTGDTYTDTDSGFTYEWDGSVWKSYSANKASNIRKLDDISGSFDNTTTTFALAVSGTALSPANAQQLEINLGGVIQAAGTDYTIDGSNIVFTTAPNTGVTFSGKSFGLAVSINTPGDGTVTPASMSTTGNYTFNNINSTGVGTFSGDLSVGGNLNVTGDVSYDEVTGTNINISGVATIATLNVTGGGKGVGIQSAGEVIGYGVTILNFVGTGNSIQTGSSSDIIDIQISGGSGGGSVGVSSNSFSDFVSTGVTHFNFVGAAVTAVGLTTAVVRVTKTLVIGRRDAVAVELSIPTGTTPILLRDGSTVNLPV